MQAANPLPFRRRAAMLVILWLALVAVPVLFPSAILPFAGSALIAYLVAPMVNWLASQRVRGRLIPRWVAILLIYAAFFVLVYLFMIAIVPQLYREMVRISSTAFAFARSFLAWSRCSFPNVERARATVHSFPVAGTTRR